jgi:hypothetical protein
MVQSRPIPQTSLGRGLWVFTTRSFGRAQTASAFRLTSVLIRPFSLIEYSQQASLPHSSRRPGHSSDLGVLNRVVLAVLGASHDTKILFPSAQAAERRPRTHPDCHRDRYTSESLHYAARLA